MSKQLLCSVILILTGWVTANADDSKKIVEDLFRAGAVSSLQVSPGGDHVAFLHSGTVKAGNPTAGYAEVFELGNLETLYRLAWVGQSILAIDFFDSSNNGNYLYIVRLAIGNDGYKVEETFKHKIRGYIHDPLPESEDEIIFAQVRFDSEIRATDLRRFHLFKENTKGVRRRDRVNTGSDEFYYYLANSDGEYTVGIRTEDRRSQVWTRDVGGKDWSLIWSTPVDRSFRPFSVSPDGRFLWAVTDAFTDKAVAAEISLQTGELERILFEHERFDVSHIVISRSTGQIDGFSYRDQGLQRYEYVNDQALEQFEKLQNQFPDKGLLISGGSLDGRINAIFATSSQERGSLHLCDMVTSTCDLIQTVAPWLDEYELSESVAISVPSETGVLVDAFLTMPADQPSSVPLIVMPHGGPIGVSDSRYFAPDAQWLALNGYAVLQVNYRGSSGYGRSFERAGLQELGRGIEDDIEKATYAVLDQYPSLDRDRVGIFGGSYGGYSALMSVIRNPDLFQCAASWAGVTDLTLLFSNARMHNNQPLRDRLVEIVGDPELDRDEQTQYSPVYRYQEISKPVLLGHGIEDIIVDVEHSWRLRQLLRLNKQNPEFIILDGVGHGFEYVNQASQFFVPLVEFLDKHLKPAEPEETL